VAFDYLSLEAVMGAGWKFQLLTVGLRMIGEPVLFGIDMTMPAKEHAAKFLEKVGLKLLQHTPMNIEASGRAQFSGVVVAAVPGFLEP